ncbi:MAG TPA: 4Fe-4S dicluster domain-containing protein [Acidimicrobiales bacterium]|nr:4Fe-4S dicluster domain-containing protein [Acidimicrobiales bacterium]
MERTGAGARAVIDPAGLDAMLRHLAARGYQLIGPTVRDGAIVHAPIDGIEDLPAGWGDVQSAGSYRLRRRGDGALFGHAVGPESARRFLTPPTRTLWSAIRTPDGFEVEVEVAAQQQPPVALIGLRPCDLAAIAVQDRTLAGPRPDPAYVEARRRSFVVAVSCSDPASTCFCTSTGTGPTVVGGHDLALAELLHPRHRFLVDVGTDAGADVLEAIPHSSPSSEDLEAVAAAGDAAVAAIRRRLDPRARELTAAMEHPRWDDVAARCLSCGSCTLVCPTCFCTSVVDTTDLAGARAARVQRWESCFALDHSFVHGGSVRVDVRSRYRQWLTHKLATWWEQFGISGCVGCGRCIAWCPAGIDLTAEVAAIVQDHQQEVDA